MKKVIILVVVVVVCVLAWYFLRDKVSELPIPKVEILEKPATPPSPAKVDTPKPTPPTGSPMVEDKMPLIDSVFASQLPNSFAPENASDPTKSDLVIDVLSLGEAGSGALPPRIRLTQNVWLDTSSLRVPSDAASKTPGQSMLVHLKSAAPLNAKSGESNHIMECATESIPSALAERLRKQAWRSALGGPTGNLPSKPLPPFWWASEFMSKVGRGELKGIVKVEGTFDAYQRATGNSGFASVTLKEAKGQRFQFLKATGFANYAEAAEKLRKQGHNVTIKMTVNLDESPKIRVQDHLSWNIPVTEQFDYWDKRMGMGEKLDLRNSLALMTWAETRALGEEAARTYAKTRAAVSTKSMTNSGRPTTMLRVQLADEVYDQWFYEGGEMVWDGSHPITWQKNNKVVYQDFYAVPKSAWVVLKTNPKGESTGDLYQAQ